MNAAASSRLLVVLPLIPWPIRRDGLSVRFAPIIDYLARRYELDVLILGEDTESEQRAGPLELCGLLTVIQVPIMTLSTPMRKLRIAWSGLVPWEPPFGASRHFDRRKLEEAIADYLNGKSYASIVWAAGHFDVALRIRAKYPAVRFVVDFVDSPTLAFSRAVYLRPDQQALFLYTKWKWRYLERRVQDIVDATIYVSKVDARTARRTPASRVHVVPNGITFTDAPTPLVRGQHGNRTIGYLGNMSYQPNVSAVLRLARRIFPGILAAIADARLLIIGRDPTDEIKDLRSGIITVTGTVEDIWAYLTRVSVLVLPMVEGAGLQNKVLEAMYAGVPVVTTTVVALGVGATDGEHLLVGNSDQEIIDNALRLLRDGAYADRLAGLARNFVLQEFVWQTILPRYDTIVSPGGSARSSNVGRGKLLMSETPQVANRRPKSQL